jgi:tetratricopeptide (TPR) repeat protein
MAFSLPVDAGIDGTEQAQSIELSIERADALIAKQDFAGAIELLRQATHAVRRSAGLYDLRQRELLLRLVDVQSQSGDLETAADDLSYMLRISESGYGTGSLAYGQALSEVAGWQCRIGLFMRSRQTYRESIEALEHHGATEPLVAALRGLARCCVQELSSAGVTTSDDSLDSYRGPIVRSLQFSPSNPAFRVHVFKFFRPDAEEALQRAVELAATLDARTQMDVLLQAGDWFLAKDFIREARRYYARADALARAGGVEDALSVPTQVFYPLPAAALRTRHLADSDTDEDFVEVEFTVRGDGRVIDEKVIDHGPGKSTVMETLSALRAARFRPRIVQGKTQITEGVRFRQSFRRAK